MFIRMGQKPTNVELRDIVNDIDGKAAVVKLCPNNSLSPCHRYLFCNKL